MSPTRFASSVITISIIAAGSMAVAACGSDAPTASNLSPTARLGLRLAQDAGCASCHGADWEGGVGPTLRGLAGSTVVLSDGTTVVADTAHLTESIADPGATMVKDYAIAMPENTLSDEEIAQIVAFIEELGADAP